MSFGWAFISCFLSRAHSLHIFLMFFFVSFYISTTILFYKIFFKSTYSSFIAHERETNNNKIKINTNKKNEVTEKKKLSKFYGTSVFTCCIALRCGCIAFKFKTNTAWIHALVKNNLETREDGPMLHLLPPPVDGLVMNALWYALNGAKIIYRNKIANNRR